jgi:hypothetical protein
MITKKQTEIKKDLSNKKLLVTREFDAPVERYGKPGQKVKSWINGGLQNHGKQEQKVWILEKVVPGFIVWKVLRVNNTGAGQILQPLCLKNYMKAQMHFAMKTETLIMIFRDALECSIFTNKLMVLK